MLSSNPSYLGQMYLRTGFHQNGLAYLECSLELCTQGVDCDVMEISWAEHNIGEAYLTMMELDKAHEWFERAAATWKEWAKERVGATRPRRGYSPFQRMSMATCLFYMGRFDDARAMAKEPLEEYLANFEEQKNNAG